MYSFPTVSCSAVHLFFLNVADREYGIITVSLLTWYVTIRFSSVQSNTWGLNCMVLMPVVLTLMK